MMAGSGRWQGSRRWAVSSEGGRRVAGSPRTYVGSHVPRWCVGVLCRFEVARGSENTGDVPFRERGDAIFEPTSRGDRWLLWRWSSRVRSAASRRTGEHGGGHRPGILHPSESQLMRNKVSSECHPPRINSLRIYSSFFASESDGAPSGSSRLSFTECQPHPHKRKAPPAETERAFSVPNPPTSNFRLKKTCERWAISWRIT